MNVDVVFPYITVYIVPLTPGQPVSGTMIVRSACWSCTVAEGDPALVEAVLEAAIDVAEVMYSPRLVGVELELLCFNISSSFLHCFDAIDPATPPPTDPAIAISTSVKTRKNSKVGMPHMVRLVGRPSLPVPYVEYVGAYTCFAVSCSVGEDKE